MHLSSMHKYVIISITYLTPKPVKACLGSQSLRLCIREDGGRHRPKTQPPTPFPYDASNQGTNSPYMKITASIRHQNGALHLIFLSLHPRPDRPKTMRLNRLILRLAPGRWPTTIQGGDSVLNPMKIRWTASRCHPWRHGLMPAALPG